MTIYPNPLRGEHLPWIELWDGTPFPVDAEPQDLSQIIEPEMVAVALSRNCRYAGHTKRFYTVLEHTLIMAEWVERQVWSTPIDVLTALHHDDAEAIMGDLPRPIKEQMPEFKRLERHLDIAFAMRWGTPYPFPPWLKQVDTRILKDERGAVMRKTLNHWQTDSLLPVGVKFRPLCSLWPWYGRQCWLAMHYRQQGLIEGFDVHQYTGEDFILQEMI